MRWVLAVPLLVLVLAAAVIAFAPAGVVLGYLRDNSNGALAYDTTHGTVWRGTASGVVINAEPVGRLDWTLSPWAALRARIDARVRVDGPQGSGAGRIRRQGDVWQVDDAQARLPATLLAGILAQEGLVPHGQLLLELEHLTLRGRLPEAAHGRLRWSDAAVSGTSRAYLGELVAEFGTDDGRLDGLLSDTGGPLGLEGVFHVSWLGYGVEMILTPRNPTVASVLSRVGQPDVGQSRLYAVEGRWLAPATAPGG